MSIILGIESTAHTFGIGIVKNRKILANVKRSYTTETGGIIPIEAAKFHFNNKDEIYFEALSQANISEKEIDAIALSNAPGLAPCLLEGMKFAKELSEKLNKPLVPVNHLVAHFYANFLRYPLENYLTTTSKNLPVSSLEEIQFPALVLVVSGGHTDLVLMHGHGNLQYLGGTLDDAAGEAFDKTARILGIADYLGGIKLSQRAAECTENTLAGVLPRPMIDRDSYDFSFSGLKTAVKRLIENGNHPVEVVACEFETAVVDVLVAKTIKAAENFEVRSILLGGGVAANKPLRARLDREARKLGIPLFMPEIRLCGDNASTVASAAFFNFNPVEFTDLSPNPLLGITS